ncbi:MAG: hypothetical protein SFW65_01550 [Alphaproteobacteria bacterium]|nr:hypothetical protein [Alphaproteobacteria bacterium]
MTLAKSLALAAVLTVGVASSAFAYQVTGPILELTDSKIVVQKGKEKWEIARTGATEIPVDAKVGDKVTIEYGMTAEKVEMKGAKKAEKQPTAHPATATAGEAAPTHVSTKAPKPVPAPAVSH